MTMRRSFAAAIVGVAAAVAALSAARAAEGSGAGDQEPWLSPLENEILHEQNLARTHPHAYARYLRQWLPYYDGTERRLPGRLPVLTVEGTRGVEEAIRFLEQQDPLPPLQPSRGLSRAARDHVNDTGPKGWTGHTGSDDSQPGDRVSRYGRWYHRVGENISYGGFIAREIVMRLIIDDGVPDRGHRHNMFNPEFHLTGIAFGDHRDFGTMCVITYTTAYDEY